MPRAYWKGHLKLCLVSIPVELFNAVDSSAGISFRQIHKPSGRRINYEKVVQGVGKIDSSDIVKGYETGKDTYLILEPEEIELQRCLKADGATMLLEQIGKCLKVLQRQPALACQHLNCL